MTTRKLPYGMKGDRVRALLAYSPDKTDKQIARKVGCHPTYVRSIRIKEYEHEARALESEGLIARVTVPLEQTPELNEALYKITSGTGRTDPKRDEVTQLLDERDKRYGKFLDHARVTQRLKTIAHQFAREHNKRFDVDQAEALDMIFHKIGRVLNGDPNYADNWLDIAGYAKLVADRLGDTSR
jgi:hypothetical protein